MATINQKIVIFLSAICGVVKAANILALMGIASPSHHIWNSVLINELGARGHNLTVLSVDVPKKSEKVPENVHYIHLKDVYYLLYDPNEQQLNLSDYTGKENGIFEGIFTLHDFCLKNAESVLKSRGNEILQSYPDSFKFDLVVFDYTCGPYLLWHLDKFKYPPMVGVSAFLNPPNTIDLAGGHKYPGYVPYFSLPYAAEMNFIERMTNTIVYAADILHRRYVFMPRLDALVRNYTQVNFPYLGELQQRTALVLVNSHPAVNYPEALPPNVIEVGGLQILDPKPLPKEIEDFINSSKKGTIFFSLGTNMKSTDLGPERCQIILDAMAQIPEYNFLWKSDIEVEKYKIPRNILIRTFFPQSDILAHPKLKAFVTHAGGLSTQEAIWRGVPMVGLPLFDDQHRNLQQSLHLGFAEKIAYSDLSTDILRDTIRKVAENPRYAENMKLYSSLYADRPMRALDTAVWWIEYVLRNPEPSHLRSPVLDIGFIRANSLDFIAIVLLVFCIIIWLMVKICCRRGQTKPRKSVRVETKLKSS